MSYERKFSLNKTAKLAHRICLGIGGDISERHRGRDFENVTTKKLSKKVLLAGFSKTRDILAWFRTHQTLGLFSIIALYGLL